MFVRDITETRVEGFRDVSGLKVPYLAVDQTL